MSTRRAPWCVVPAAFLVLLATPALVAAQQQSSITGRVTDAATGQPIPAAQVRIVGTTIGAQTNTEGQYTIRGVSPGPSEVRAVRVGFAERRQSVSVAAGETATLNFQLQAVSVTLSPIVTTATGPQRRVEVGNSIAQVDAPEVVQTRSVSNAADLLTARAAGVMVIPGVQTGAGVRVRIRGLSSMSLSNNPIYIVDGVRVEGTTGSSSVSVGGTQPARVNDLNPEEIESIEVIRGPSASTLYGTDAANGVIVITTKRGVAGRPRWTYYTEQTAISDRNDYPTAYWGWRTGPTAATTSSPSNTVQCLLFQVAAGVCTQDSVTSYNLHDDPESTPYGVGYRQQHGLQVGGGSERIRYFLHGEWEDEDGVTQVPRFDRRYLAFRGLSLRPEQESPNHLTRASARANVDVALSGDADVAVSAGYISQDLRLPMSDDSGVSGIAANTYGGPGFKYNLTTAGDTLYGWRAFTPRDVYQATTNQAIERMIGSVRTNWRPRDWLALRANFGLDYINRTDTQLCRFANCPDVGTDRLGFKIDNRTNFYQYTLDAAATGTRRFTDVIESRTTAGLQFTRGLFERNGAEGRTLPPGATTVTAGATKAADEATSESRTLGAFLEEHLAIRDRLFVTGAIRSDRNSAFGADFKTVFYPKFSASWLVSEEDFFPTPRWLNQLRLRTAYGASGVQPGTIDAVAYFAATRTLGESGELPGVVFSALGNTNLRPERSTELELGVDGTFWNNRLTTEVTYYNKVSKDALISRILPPSLGTGEIDRFENLGRVRNWGWEAMVTAELLRRDALGWDVSVNGSTNSNELESLGGIPEIVVSSTQQHRETYPLYGWWSRRLVSWADKDGDGIIEYSADPNVSEIVVSDAPEYHGYSVPRHEVVFTNGLDFWQRRFRLVAMIDYKGGHLTYNNTERIRCASRNNCSGLINPKSSLYEQARTVAVRQHPSRTVAGFFEKGDFVRFRELSLSFTAPEPWVGRFLRGRSLVAALAVRNLGILWTDYTGVDPEAYGTTGNAPSEFQAFGPPTYISFRLNLGL
jgi:TonB-linked SusC/RagA family outer membrane protein